MEGTREHLENLRLKRIARFADLSDQALIERAVEALLARRGLEYMDVYLVYWTRRDPRYNEEVAPHD